MATVTKRRRKLADGTYRDEGWQVRYTDPDGKPKVRRGFALKRDADRVRAEIETAITRHTYVDAAAGKETFEQYAERWRLAQAHKPQTVNAVERRLRVHVYPVFGDRPIGAIRHSDVTGLKKSLLASCKASYARKIVADVKAVLNGAVLDRVIAVSPAARVALPKTPKRRPEDVVLFDTAEFDAIRAALPGRWKLAADLGIAAGLRIGEVLGLRVERVDFLRRAIVVAEQMQTIQGVGVVLVAPKTDESRRTIPVPDELLARVTEHVAEFCPAGGLLFTLESGGNVSSAMWSQVWTAAVEKAKLAEGTRFHWLRHTYASFLIHGGCSPKEVQARMGHATIRETLDTYGHLWPSSEDRTRQASAKIFERESDQDRTSVTPVGV